MLKIISPLSLLFLLSLSAAAFGVDDGDRSIPLLSPALHPASEAAFVPSPDELPAVNPAPDWYVRTGARKGLSGQAVTGPELFVAPDIAVLSRGLSPAWNALFAGYQETTALVQADDIAGLAGSKDLLIVPSGALAGTALSGFFKAGLAEYVRQGGTLFCLTQRKGADFSALPVPEGQQLSAVGWSEDSGPLFRASRVQADHPLVRSMTKPEPLAETDGYIKTYPAGSQVLLARSDGNPTLLLYSYGKGHVLVGTLFTDLSSLLGSPEQDEMVLLKDLLAWSRTQRSADRQPDPQALPQSSETAAQNLAPSPPPPAFPFPSVRASLERTASTLTVHLELPGSAKLKDRLVLVRTGGQEKQATLSTDKTLLSFELPSAGNERRVSYTVYGKQGRSLARGSLAVPAVGDTFALPDRSVHIPGEQATFRFNGIGQGEVTLEGLGFLNDQIVADRGSMNMEVPRDLPAGTYRMQWTFEDKQGNKNQGFFPVDLAGYRAAVTDVAIKTSKDKEQLKARAQFTIKAGRNVSGQLQLMLKPPDAVAVVVAEPVLSLVEGVQTVPVSFTIDRDLAGIWELSYRLSSVLPDGAGLPSAPVTLDSGSLLFDRGDAAVLALTPDPLLLYDPAPAGLTATVTGKGKMSVEVRLDGQEVARQQLELSGTTQYPVSLPRLEAGIHTVRVSLAGTIPPAERERQVISGLRLPDVTVNLRAGEPAADAKGPVMPLTLLFRNQGKNASAPVRTDLFEGEPAKGGKPFGSIDLPALGPGEQLVKTWNWPLYEKAGPRTLVAVTDLEGKLSEVNRNNNRASLAVTVPELLLTAESPKTPFRASDRISVPLALFNLTSRSAQGLKVTSNFSGPSGKSVFTESLPVPDLKAAAMAAIEPVFKSVIPAVGAHTLSATVSGGTDPVGASARFAVLPTLLFSGSLDGTASSAVQCRPFTIKADLKNAGNVSASGTVRVEARAPGEGEALLVRNFPLAAGAQNVKIDRLDLPHGKLTLRLTASAASDQFKLSRELVLAERDLTVKGPVEVKRLTGTFPRVLVLRGTESRRVEQAVADAMLQQAFDQEESFLKIVESEEEFTSQAMTGMFNVYVLFEPHEMVKAGWLKERIARGQGVLIIGTGAAPVSIAQDLGFSFKDLPDKKSGATLAFSDNSPLGLTGTLPVTGKGLEVSKTGARPAAVFSSTNQPAMLVDATGKGKVIVMPLPVSHSAYEDGTSALYSLVLKKAGILLTPEEDDGAVLSGALSLSSPGGPVSARVAEALPAGATALWSNLESKASGTTVTYRVQADRDPKRLLYVYQAPAGERRTGSAEVFFECDGRYISQGKVE